MTSRMQLPNWACKLLSPDTAKAKVLCSFSTRLAAPAVRQSWDKDTHKRVHSADVPGLHMLLDEPLQRHLSLSHGCMHARHVAPLASVRTSSLITYFVDPVYGLILGLPGKFSAASNRHLLVIVWGSVT